MNDATIVECDHALETKAANSGEELAAYRWHWTLDESNPERMSIRAYAQLVGRGKTTIHEQVTGYDRWRVRDTPDSRSLADHIEAVGLGVEREAATTAVAEAQGTTFANVAANKRDEVTSTLGVARERAESRGTDVQDELRLVAERREAGRQAAQQERRDRQRMRSAEFIRYEGQLGKVARLLRAMLEEGDPAFGVEERELLEVTLGNVRALLSLVEMRLAGATDVDWDTELARLGAQS